MGACALCIDYRELTVSIRNRYPLPVDNRLLEPLLRGGVMQVTGAESRYLGHRLYLGGGAGGTVDGQHRIGDPSKVEAINQMARRPTSVTETGVKLIGIKGIASVLDFIGQFEILDRNGEVGDEAVHKELGDRMERAATTASSLEAEQDSDVQTRFETTSKQSNDPPLSRVNTTGSGGGKHETNGK
ncbi:hypothetical protein Tco_0090189 [Tanacetum coccineum]